MDGDPELETAAKPSVLGGPENHTGSQVTWLRGSAQDREEEAPETVPPQVVVEMR